MADQALGIPDRSSYGDTTSLAEGSVATLVRQLHHARRAGDHEDLRIGDPRGLLSWAVPKTMPDDGSRRLAVMQPLHRWGYRTFEGRLGHGYGEGTVEKMEESPVVILKSTDGHLMFTRGDRRDAPRYSLVRTRGKDWLLMRHGDTPEPPEVAAYAKEHFRSVPVSAVPGMLEGGATLTKKIDGAGALLLLGATGARAFGIRPNREGRHPEYTDLIGGLRGMRVPPELRGTLLRAEVFGQRQGRSIPATELSGILNGTVLSAARRREAGTRLLLAALAVRRNGVDDYSPGAAQAVADRLDSPQVLAPRHYAGDEARSQLAAVLAGKDPLTREGVVVHRPGARPVKAKAVDDSDVVIRGVFPSKAPDGRAGGFEYSLPGSDRVVGRVGTGFDHGLLRDMAAHPDAYIGRVARIRSQEQYPSGAYRSPSFVELKDD